MLFTESARERFPKPFPFYHTEAGLKTKNLPDLLPFELLPTALHIKRTGAPQLRCPVLSKRLIFEESPPSELPLKRGVARALTAGLILYEKFLEVSVFGLFLVSF